MYFAVERDKEIKEEKGANSPPYPEMGPQMQVSVSQRNVYKLGHTTKKAGVTLVAVDFLFVEGEI